MATTLREILRAETDAAHQRLHHHASFAALAGGAIHRVDYVDLIRRLHGFYVPLDLAIERALSANSNAFFRYEKRADLLARDLTDLGEDPSPEQWRGADEVVTPQTIGGALYVVEGAVLGGSLIDRAASRVLDPASTSGRGYWAWCRAEGKQRWPLTLSYLDRLSALGHRTDDIIRGASGTFAGLSDWLAPLDRPTRTCDLGAH